MKVVLIGFMGAGKSTVSKILAAILALKVIETDELVVKKSGLSSPREIFEKSGEDFFRKLETEVSLTLTDVEEVVISAGGGIVTNPVNIKALKNGCQKMVYLRTTFDELVRRCSKDQSRPLFKDLDYARKLYQTRLPLYEKWADATIDTDGLTPEEVTTEIAAKLV